MISFLAREIMSHKLIMASAVIIGLGMGHLMVQNFIGLPRHPSPRANAPLDHPINYSFADEPTREKLNLVGWSAANTKGAWMTAPVASFSVPIDTIRSPQFSLLMKGMVKLKRGLPAPPNPIVSVRIVVNGQALGLWPIWNSTRYPQRRFVVATSEANSAEPITVQLLLEQSDRSLPSGSTFGLEGFEVGNLSDLTDFRGQLDYCQGSTMSGWAVADGLPMPVDVYAADALLSVSQTPVYREDLRAAGLPPEAGFKIMLSPPLTPGTKVSLTYRGRPDRKLTNAVCVF